MSSTIPTYCRQRLGAEVRRIRTAAGMSAEQAAALLGMDRGKIPLIESGARTISEERLRTLAANCGCADEVYISRLVEMASRRPRRWWDEYRGKLPPGMLDIAELEWHAQRMHTFQAIHMPGLLQTEDYARALFDAAIPPLPKLEVEYRVAFRQQRQQVLLAGAAPEYLAYVHEATLRMQFGGRETTRAQLDYVNEQADRPNVRVRVIPVAAGVFPGAGTAMFYAEGPVRTLDTVQLDSTLGAVFMHADAQLAKYRSHFAWMEEAALPEQESRDFIHGIAREL
ncbi:Scr1 family TA system antitoxin-like transcriptional regulator [Streptomyces sp. NPDC101132]|uniref:helix-turn-helix domain-containing protein n=1 Tax=Streptomyces sp. NPDC101132 TaxID=3366110 RepID=UPI0037FE00D8